MLNKPQGHAQPGHLSAIAGAMCARAARDGWSLRGFGLGTSAFGHRTHLDWVQIEARWGEH